MSTALGYETPYDRTGAPITAEEYRRLRADRRYKIVAQTTVGTQEVRTSWFGMDQGPLGDVEEPLIFGTIVYNTTTSTFDDLSERFTSTEADAMALHRQVVESLRG